MQLPWTKTKPDQKSTKRSKPGSAALATVAEEGPLDDDALAAQIAAGGRDKRGVPSPGETRAVSGEPQLARFAARALPTGDELNKAATIAQRVSTIVVTKETSKLIGTLCGEVFRLCGLIRTKASEPHGGTAADIPAKRVRLAVMIGKMLSEVAEKGLARRNYSTAELEQLAAALELATTDVAPNVPPVAVKSLSDEDDGFALDATLSE